jgi:hypothetical protein
MRLKRPLSNAKGRGKAAWVWSGGRGGGLERGDEEVVEEVRQKQT